MQNRRPSGYGRPPRRRGAFGQVLRFLLLVLALVLLALFLNGAINGPVQRSTERSLPPGAQYANENYQVPRATTNPPGLPYPENAEEIDWVLRDNPWYANTVAAPVRCELPPGVNAGTATDAQLKRYLEEQMACLMRVWGPTFENSELFDLYRPTVTIYGQRVNTPCGTSDVNAFYCPANQQLYYSRNLPRSQQLSLMGEPHMIELVMAHEFAHLIQGRVAITAAGALESRNASRAEQSAGSRRMETQADCLSGMYLRSVDASMGYTDLDRSNFRKLYFALGDDVLSGDPTIVGDHGTGESRRNWGERGLTTDQIARCNSWVAPAPEVR